MSADFEFGSGPGLDKHLPEGERILWQGAPDARVFARRVFFIRGVAIYFALIAAWRLLEQGGAPVLDSGLVILLGAAIVALGLLSVLAWGYARTTAYTLTDARLVIRSGIALPVSFNLPLAHLTGADVKRYRDGSGTIAVQIDDTAHLAYPHLWPSVRPWRFRHPEPALRCLGLAERS
ncbi:MAG: photosynthetic complex putative assembly protein PuhB, partial [Pseudomonadota bacterium]